MIVGEFLQWWIEQLSALIPPALRRLDEPGRRAIVLAVDDGTITTTARRRGEPVTVGRFPADPHGISALAEALDTRSRRVSAALAVAPAALLRKPLSLPLLAKKNLRQVLELEMEHETPFAADEVIWDHRISRQDRASGRMDVELFLLPRENIAAALDLAAEAGVKVEAIEIVVDGAPLCLRLAGATAAPALTQRYAGAVLAAAAALLALTAAALPFGRLELALIDARADVAALREKATAVTELRNQIELMSRPEKFFARERSRVREPLAVLAAVTRALPDDTYLTEFALRGERAILVGMSPAAANLIAPISAAAPLQDATFGAPVVRPDGNKLELFTINATVAAGGGNR